MSEILHVYADLVRPPGLKHKGDKACTLVFFHNVIVRDGALPAGKVHDTLQIAALLACDRCRDHSVFFV